MQQNISNWQQHSFIISHNSVTSSSLPLLFFSFSHPNMTMTIIHEQCLGTRVFVWQDIAHDGRARLLWRLVDPTIQHSRCCLTNINAEVNQTSFDIQQPDKLIWTHHKPAEFPLLKSCNLFKACPYILKTGKYFFYVEGIAFKTHSTNENKYPAVKSLWSFKVTSIDQQMLSNFLRIWNNKPQAYTSDDVKLKNSSIFQTTDIIKQILKKAELNNYFLTPVKLRMLLIPKHFQLPYRWNEALLKNGKQTTHQPKMAPVWKTEF